MKRNGLTGTVEQARERLGLWREKTGISRVYLQVLDLSDLDHVELLAGVTP